MNILTDEFLILFLFLDLVKLRKFNPEKVCSSWFCHVVPHRLQRCISALMDVFLHVFMGSELAGVSVASSLHSLLQLLSLAMKFQALLFSCACYSTLPLVCLGKSIYFV